MPPNWQSRSSFETVLDDIFANTNLFDVAPKSAPVSIDTLEAAWALAAERRKSPAKPPPMGESKPKQTYVREESAAALLDPSKIGGELGLQPRASDAERAALKREFALRNHPDRVPEELRDLATRRMTLANQLIDQYVTDLRKKSVGR